jgi:hypothetical protein
MEIVVLDTTLSSDSTVSRNKVNEDNTDNNNDIKLSPKKNQKKIKPKVRSGNIDDFKDTNIGNNNNINSKNKRNDNINRKNMANINTTAQSEKNIIMNKNKKNRIKDKKRNNNNELIQTNYINIDNSNNNTNHVDINNTLIKSNKVKAKKKSSKKKSNNMSKLSLNEIYKLILNEIDDILSFSNLCGDFHLRSFMDIDGFVPLQVILSYPYTSVILQYIHHDQLLDLLYESHMNDEYFLYDIDIKV